MTAQQPIVIDSPSDARELASRTIAAIGNPKLAFIGQRASDMLLLKDILPLGGVICLDYGKDAEIIEKGLPLISLEKKVGTRRQWYSGRIKELFEDEATRAHIKNALPEGTLVVPYSSSSLLEEIAAKEGWKILAAPAAVRDALEDKIAALAMKEKLGLPNCSRQVAVPATLSFADIVREFGEPFVAQTAAGSSGTGTFIVNSDQEWQDMLARAPGQPLVLAPFVNSPIPSIKGVVTKRQVILLPAAITVTGTPEIASRVTVFGGMDLAAVESLDPELIASMRQSALKAGAYLREQGFLGAFSLDFLATKGGILTDINPRFMGSGTLNIEDQLLKDEIPFSLLHLLVFLGVDFELSPAALATLESPKSGSLIVLHSLEDEEMAIHGNLDIGYYSQEKEFLRSGYEYKGLQDGEVLVAGAVPRVGTSVEPESPLLRLYTRDRVLGDDFQLTAQFREWCRWAYRKLDLRK